MAWTPKDQDKLNRLKKESTILEQEQKKLMEDAAKLSGIAYQNAIKTIKAKGKQLTAMKGQKAILEGMVEDEEKIFKTTDKTRALEYDIAGSKAKLKKLEEDILKSTKAVGILTHKERKRLAQKMAIQKRNLDLNIKAATEIQFAQQTQDKLLASLGYSKGMLTGMVAQAKLFTIAMMKNPWIIALSALAALVLVMKDQFKLAKDINAQTGLGALKSRELAKDMQLQNKALKLIGQDAVEILGQMQDQFGNMKKVTPEAVAQIGVMSTWLGASSESLVKITGLVERLGDDSKDAGMNAIKFASALAEANDVAPGKVLEDIAENSKLFAEFGKDGGQNITRAAVAARKLGLNLSTVESIADSLLNFEESIGSEMEASMLIGKQLNFNKARELALSGDLVGAAQDVVSQIGGQAELEQMNVIQRRALADSIGVSVEELSRLAGGKMTLEDASEDISKKQNALIDGTITGMTLLGNKMDLLKVAVGALTVATIASTALKGFDMFKSGKFKNLKKFRPGMTSMGNLDKRGGLGRTIGKSKVGSRLLQSGKLGPGMSMNPFKAGGVGKGMMRRIPGVSALFAGADIYKGVKAGQSGDKEGAGKGIGSGAGALVGGALGSFLGPLGTVAGTFIGSKVGGALGGAVGRWRQRKADDKAAEAELKRLQQGLPPKETQEKVVEQNEEMKTLLEQLIAATKNVGKNVATAVTKE